jgi:hypothetical protein
MLARQTERFRPPSRVRGPRKRRRSELYACECALRLLHELSSRNLGAAQQLTSCATQIRLLRHIGQ